MKYKIEIWRFHALIEQYESDTIEDIKAWFFDDDPCWKGIYENGDCSFSVYENGRYMEFDELEKYGFYD